MSRNSFRTLLCTTLVFLTFSLISFPCTALSVFHRHEKVRADQQVAKQAIPSSHLSRMSKGVRQYSYYRYRSPYFTSSSTSASTSTENTSSQVSVTSGTTGNTGASSTYISSSSSSSGGGFATASALASGSSSGPSSVAVDGKSSDPTQASSYAAKADYVTNAGRVCVSTRSALCQMLSSSTDQRACRFIMQTGRRANPDPFPTGASNFDSLAAQKGLASADKLLLAGFLAILLSPNACTADVTRDGLAMAGLARAAPRFFPPGGTFAVVHDAIQAGRTSVMWCTQPPCAQLEPTELRVSSRRRMSPRRRIGRRLFAAVRAGHATQVSLGDVVSTWKWMLTSYRQCNSDSVDVRKSQGGWITNVQC